MSSPTTRRFPALESDGGAGRPIAEFVTAVRAQLDDLAPDEVTELTGGLEADLTDALADAADPTLVPGDPAAYADELRAAAGLPPRGATPERSPRPPAPPLATRIEQGVVVPARQRLATALERLDAQPWWPSVRDFLVAVRPAWWVIRAWVLLTGLRLVVLGPGSSLGFGGLMVLLALIVVSVQLGRRSAAPTFGPPDLVVVLWNVAAGLLLLPVVLSGASSSSAESYDSYEPPPGLASSGDAVSNVFPYDAAGRPLTGVQLFDQDGRPLEVGEDARSGYDEVAGQGFDLVPGSDPWSAPRWNAFPLQRRVYDSQTGRPGPVVPAPLPLSGGPDAGPSASATSSGSPSPSGAPTPSESASSEPTPSEPTPSKPAPSESASVTEDGTTTK